MDRSGIDTRACARRQRAIACARLVVEDFRAIGIEAKIIGSLAKGGFGPRSDVDILIVSCPRALKYAIEGLAEDRFGDIAFDIVYRDEVPARKLAAFEDGAIDASCLR